MKRVVTALLMFVIVFSLTFAAAPAQAEANTPTSWYVLQTTDYTSDVLTFGPISFIIIELEGDTTQATPGQPVDENQHRFMLNGRHRAFYRHNINERVQYRLAIEGEVTSLVVQVSE